MHVTNSPGISFTPGYFLADQERCTRLTHQISASHAQAVSPASGGKFVPMGAIYPANDGTAIGIVYEPVDVSHGDAAGSVVVSGVVYADRLPALADAAKTALEGAGIQFIDNAPTITRP